MDLNFVTVGDKNYFESIKLSVSQARKIYPKSKYFIYDWGFTVEQRKELINYDNVDGLINWKDEFIKLKSIDATDWTPVYKDYMKKNVGDNTLLQTAKNLIKKYFLFRRDYWKSKYKAIEEHKKKEFYLSQKPFCYLDCLKRCEGKLVCLDGDAFIVNKIDNLLEKKFDVGVTLRRMHEIENKYNRCQVLNSGVIFFNGKPEKSIAFIEQWIDRMSNTCEYLIEQTSLTRLIEKDDPNIFNDYYQQGIVRCRDKNVQVEVLPCERYNFNWIEEGINPEKNRVIHFKGGRHFEDNFKKLVKQLNIDLTQ